jgi:ATPase subunit of ABC transporter with duplicated ATPase domains
MNGENANMSVEEQQETIMELLSTIYERLDALDASTAETRARSILKGLGFTHAMQVSILFLLLVLYVIRIHLPQLPSYFAV